MHSICIWNDINTFIYKFYFMFECVDDIFHFYSLCEKKNICEINVRKKIWVFRFNGWSARLLFGWNEKKTFAPLQITELFQQKQLHFKLTSPFLLCTCAGHQHNNNNKNNKKAIAYMATIRRWRRRWNFAFHFHLIRFNMCKTWLKYFHTHIVSLRAHT